MDSKFSSLATGARPRRRGQSDPHRIGQLQLQGAHAARGPRTSAAAAGGRRSDGPAAGRLVVAVEGPARCPAYDLRAPGVVDLHRSVLWHAAEHSVVQSRAPGGEHDHCG